MYSNKSVSVHVCYDIQSRGGGYFLPLLAYELNLNVKRKDKRKKQTVGYFGRKVDISMMKKEKKSLKQNVSSYVCHVCTKGYHCKGRG